MEDALDLLTTPYCFNKQEAEQMADAGADIIVAHMGLTTKGAIGAKRPLSSSTRGDRRLLRGLQRMERLPTERAIAKQGRHFTDLRLSA